MLAARAQLARRYRLINLSALALAICWFGLIGLTLSPRDDDFRIYRQGAISFIRTGDPYLPTSTEDAGALSQTSDGATAANGYIYPPLLVYLLQPFGRLDYRQGRLIWFSLNGIALAGLIVLCIRLSGSELARRYWGLVALGTLLVPPTRLGLQLGQTGIWMAFLLVASLALERRNARIAGFLLALASLIKVYPAFLGLYYVLRRPRSAVCWSIIAGVLVLAASLLVYGPTPYTSYLHRLLDGSYHPYAAEFNTSLHGLWFRLFSPSRYGIALANLPLLTKLLTALTGLGVLWLCYRTGANAADDLEAHMQRSVWLCGMMLLSPLNGIYNLVLLLLPLLAILRYLGRHPDHWVRRWLLLATALVCIPPLWSTWFPAFFDDLHTGWGLLLLTPPFYGLLIYLALSALLAHRCRSAAHPARFVEATVREYTAIDPSLTDHTGAQSRP